MLRIVKMTFHPEKTDEFISIFKSREHLIRSFEGCKHLELWRNVDDESVFFTYSIWENVEALDAYRRSELFADTWAETKKLFATKAEAWSVDKV